MRKIIIILLSIFLTLISITLFAKKKDSIIFLSYYVNYKTGYVIDFEPWFYAYNAKYNQSDTSNDFVIEAQNGEAWSFSKSFLTNESYAVNDIRFIIDGLCKMFPTMTQEQIKPVAQTFIDYGRIPEKTEPDMPDMLAYLQPHPQNKNFLQAFTFFKSGNKGVIIQSMVLATKEASDQLASIMYKFRFLSTKEYSINENSYKHNYFKFQFTTSNDYVIIPQSRGFDRFFMLSSIYSPLDSVKPLFANIYKVQVDETLPAEEQIQDIAEAHISNTQKGQIQNYFNMLLSIIKKPQIIKTNYGKSNGLRAIYAVSGFNQLGIVYDLIKVGNNYILIVVQIKNIDSKDINNYVNEFTKGLKVEI